MTCRRVFSCVSGDLLHLWGFPPTYISGGLLLHLWGYSPTYISGDLLLPWSPEQREVFSCEAVMGWVRWSVLDKRRCWPCGRCESSVSSPQPHSRILVGVVDLVGNPNLCTLPNISFFPRGAVLVHRDASVGCMGRLAR